MCVLTKHKVTQRGKFSANFWISAVKFMIYNTSCMCNFKKVCSMQKNTTIYVYYFFKYTLKHFKNFG